MDDDGKRLSHNRLCICQVVRDAIDLCLRNGDKLGIASCSAIHSQQTPIGAEILRPAQTCCAATAVNQWVDDNALAIWSAPDKFVAKNHWGNASSAVPQKSRDV